MHAGILQSVPVVVYFCAFTLESSADIFIQNKKQVYYYLYDMIDPQIYY